MSAFSTPLGSQANMVHDVNITKLLFDCLDAMRVSRDEANELLKDVTELLPDVLAGFVLAFNEHCPGYQGPILYLLLLKFQLLCCKNA